MCIRDRGWVLAGTALRPIQRLTRTAQVIGTERNFSRRVEPVSYTHLRAHETVLDLVCRLLLEKKNHN